ILKAPRNPLDDLGNGNEMTQDIHVERRRRSSRRVSFANTIKVFQRDLKNSMSETENTGMNTLLHAPIQALGQQTEWHEMDHATPRMDRQDTTLFFSEENEMEMTASHTAMISRNLRDHQPDRTEKIDFTSFLAKLNSSQGKAESSKELSLLSDPTNHPGLSLEQKEEAATVKKIDFNEFLLRLKSNSPAETPDKENVCFVPSQGSGDVARPSGEFGYSHEPLDTCNVTKVFRGREGGMEMTKCEAADVRISFPGGSVSSETVFRGDKTVVFSECDDMEMTGNYRDIICKASTTEKDRTNTNSQNSERQEKPQPVRAASKVLPTRGDSDRHFSMGKTGSSREELKAPPSAHGLLRRGAEEPVWARTSEAPQGSSQSSLFGEKSVVFPHGENIDMTGRCVVMVPDYSINVVVSQNKAAPGCFGQGGNETMSLGKGARTTAPAEQGGEEAAAGGSTISSALAQDMEITTIYTAQRRQPIPAIPADTTIVFAHDQEDMDITASHTVAVSKNIRGFVAQQ
ncbi:KNL1 protein, partial [Chaetorhynchus papuensis]|nr:KNL1 protein [Chaetorhynchus papuensis]